MVVNCIVILLFTNIVSSATFLKNLDRGWPADAMVDMTGGLCINHHPAAMDPKVVDTLLNTKGSASAPLANAGYFGEGEKGLIPAQCTCLLHNRRG